MPNCSTNDGQTTGTITFRTVIQDQFTDDALSGDYSVDHGDVLNDTVNVTGNLLSVTDNNAPHQLQPEADGSAAEVQIAFGGLTKSIYAVNGSTVIPSGIATGDDVTFRLVYTLPTSDFETLILTDFMPLPVFEVGDPDADGAAEAWVFDDVISAAAPAAGHYKFGPSETFRPFAGDAVGCTGSAPTGSPPANADGTPCINVDTTGNSIAF